MLVTRIAAKITPAVKMFIVRLDGALNFFFCSSFTRLSLTWSLPGFGPYIHFEKLYEPIITANVNIIIPIIYKTACSFPGSLHKSISSNTHTALASRSLSINSLQIFAIIIHTIANTELSANR